MSKRYTPVCPICNRACVYSDKYDAYFCAEHGWLQSKCGDPACAFCVARPERPPVCLRAVP